MLFALAAAFLFACSGVSAQRSSSMLGPIKANALRLMFSCLVLGAWALATASFDLSTTAAWRLYVSGAIGFGLGDMALFFALPRLGARLTLLINLCTAPLFGVAGDHLLLGTRLEPVHAICCAIILAGVSQALMARRTTNAALNGSRTVGCIAAFFAGLGQGTGASLSRWAHAAEEAAHAMLPSHVESFLRVVPGTLIVVAFWLIIRRSTERPAWAAEKSLSPKAASWVAANAVFGAVLGVTCFQHALLEVSSAVALSITATTPILVMPMTAYSEGDVPSARSVFGAAVAVAGVVMLKLGIPWPMRL